MEEKPSDIEVLEPRIVTEGCNDEHLKGVPGKFTATEVDILSQNKNSLLLEEILRQNGRILDFLLNPVIRCQKPKNGN